MNVENKKSPCSLSNSSSLSSSSFTSSPTPSWSCSVLGGMHNAHSSTAIHGMNGNKASSCNNNSGGNSVTAFSPKLEITGGQTIITSNTSSNTSQSSSTSKAATDSFEWMKPAKSQSNGNFFYFFFLTFNLLKPGPGHPVTGVVFESIAAAFFCRRVKLECVFANHKNRCGDFFCFFLRFCKFFFFFIAYAIMHLVIDIYTWMR
jgi:hypothetical protein